MDVKQNPIPSCEETDSEVITTNIGDIVAPVNPAPINSENDCRITCTNSQSLRDIMGITLDHIEELVDSYDLKDKRSEFVSVFRESFKNALQENILVDDLPLMIDESKKLSSPERNDRLSVVDDMLFATLSKKVAHVAHERKLHTNQCCRVLRMENKHELENLKKTKFIHSSLPSTSTKTSTIDKAQSKKFTDFCQGFKIMQETVQCKLHEKEKLNMKLGLAKEIDRSQKLCLKSKKIEELH